MTSEGVMVLFGIEDINVIKDQLKVLEVRKV